MLDCFHDEVIILPMLAIYARKALLGCIYLYKLVEMDRNMHTGIIDSPNTEMVQPAILNSRWIVILPVKICCLLGGIGYLLK